MRPLHRCAVLLLCSTAAVLCSIGIQAPPAGAHTAPVPIEIDPPPGTELSLAPDEVVLVFDGAFTDDLEVELLDSSGAVVPTSTSVDGLTVVLAVDDAASMGPDTYRISWYARTTHGQDAPDGIGAESRQTHFFVGNSSSGVLMSADAPDDGSSGAGAVLLVGATAVLALVLLVLTGQRGARLVGSGAVVVVVAIGLAAVVVDGGGDTDVQAEWYGALDDGTSLAVRADDGWDLRITDAEGLATPYATAAQLRFTDPDGNDSEVVDLSVEIGELGRLTAPQVDGVGGWDTELVVSSFGGPVASFVIPTP